MRAAEECQDEIKRRSLGGLTVMIDREVEGREAKITVGGGRLRREGFESRTC